MAYRRPLTVWQMVLFALLWLALAVYVLATQPLTGAMLFLLTFSAFTVFYPILKSWRQRHGR